MVDLLQMHKLFLGAHIKEGDTVVDFTMGNGHDTLYLSNAVGETGHVFAFDIQEQALQNTRTLLTEQHAPQNYTLILDSHANMLRYIHSPFRAGVFNLGWLPGADKSVTTQHESTLAAIEAALTLLQHDGILLIAVYPGHPEGTVEGQLVEERLAQISRFHMSVSKFQIINSPASPFFFAIEGK